MREQWKDIKGYEGLYQISDLGNIKNTTTNKPMSTHLNSEGYERVGLSKDGRARNEQVHQLMAITFLNHKPNGVTKVVDHIDNNKSNNRLDNLQVINHRLNCSKDRKGYSSKYVGVRWVKKDKKWRAEIQIDGKYNYLGQFDCELRAAKAYNDKLKEIERN